MLVVKSQPMRYFPTIARSLSWDHEAGSVACLANKRQDWWMRPHIRA